jgi:benzoate/toluate 1,2-dioxygenase beta subunit
MKGILEQSRKELSSGEICAFFYREARLLDDRAWQDWLECYALNAEFWMPAWTDDDDLTTDPHSEISLIYYPNRKGLEDRIYRLNTGRSAASAPEPRTCHLVNNLEIVARHDDEIDVRYNWHTLSHRLQQTAQFFGTTFCTLDVSGEKPLIGKKKVILKNDYIHQVIDIYHL